MGRFPLHAHPDSSPDAVTAGWFSAQRWGSLVVLTYQFLCRRAEVLLPEPEGSRNSFGLYAPVRADELWKSTCFELFVRPVGGGSAYFEYNFSPAMQWAAYRFSDRRKGMASVDLVEPPKLWDNKSSEDYIYCASFQLDGSWAQRTLLFGVAAVIEEESGIKSFWALRHGDGAPDFHDPESFTIRIGPKDH